MRFRNPKTGEVYNVTGPESDCAISGFCKNIICNTCPIDKNKSEPSCYKWVLSNPYEAARLMGYEVVEDEDIPFVCQRLGVVPGQPFLVNGYPERKYQAALVYLNGQIRRYTPDGGKAHKLGGRAVCWLMEHPEAVEPRQGYTPEEVALKHKEETMSEQKKPLSEWTLGEVKDYCDKHDCYKNCVLCIKEGACRILDVPPENWDLTEEPRFTPEEVADAKTIKRVLRATGIKRDGYGDIYATGEGITDTLLDSEAFPSLAPGQSVKLEEIVGEAAHD